MSIQIEFSGRFVALGLVACLALSCAAGSTGDTGGAAEPRDAAAAGHGGVDAKQTSGADSGPGAAADSGQIAASGADTGTALSCAEMPTLRAGNRTSLTFHVDLQVGGKPVLFKEWNALPGGGRWMPTNLRFYLSEVALLGEGAEKTPVDLVTETGAPSPYGVQLIDAENAASLDLRVKAPAGDYTGLSFLLGLTEACNDTSSPRNPPLHEASQMKWPHTLGYLFVRFEGQVEAAANGAKSPPTQIHMGGFPPARPARVLTAKGSFKVPTAGVAGRVVVALDQMLAASMMPADLANFELPPPSPPGPIGTEILAGETLRQNIDKVSAFSIKPAP